MKAKHHDKHIFCLEGDCYGNLKEVKCDQWKIEKIEKICKL